MEDPKSLHDPPTQDPNPNPHPPPPSPATATATATPPSPQQPPPPPATSSPPQAAPQPTPSSPPQAPPQSTSPSPSPPPPPEAAPPPPESKKRPRDADVQLYDCSYFKMRAVLKDIRPHLLEILQTVEFRKCKGAHELQEKLKLLMELYRQMIAGAADFKNTTQQDQIFAKPSENRNFQSTVVSEMLQPDASENLGVIVGGSAFGWNFITFPGSKAVYYGRSKESFRAIQAFTEKHIVS